MERDREATMKATARMMILAIALCTSVAHAQSRDDVARADALFDAAKSLLDQGAFAEACPKLAESRRLAPGVGVSLYLGDCYEHVGKIASAWTEFRAAESLARSRRDKRADVAHARAERLEARLSRMTFTIAPDVARANPTVTRDGAVVATDQWSVAIPIDPGDHTIVVAAAAHEPRTISIHVEPSSGTTTVTIDALGPAVATPQPPKPFSPKPVASSASTPPSVAVTPPPSAPPSSTMTSQRWIAIGIAGTGMVGIGVGALFAASAKSKLDDSNQGPCDAADRCTTSGLALRQDAKDAANVATLAFGVGALAIAGSVVLYFTAPKASGLGRIGVAPMTNDRATGLSLRAAW